MKGDIIIKALEEY